MLSGADPLPSLRSGDRSLLDLLGAYALLDEHGYVLHWSPAAEALFAKPTDAVLGQSLAESVGTFEDSVDVSLLNGAGNPIDIRVRSHPVEAGRLVVFEDRSEIATVRHELTKIRDRAYRFYQHMSDGFFLIGASGNIACMNPTGERIVGFREEEVVGQPWRFLMNRLSGRGDEIIQAILAGRLTRADTFVENKTGTLVALRAYRAEEGVAVYLSSSADGATEAVFRELFNASPEAQLLLDQNIVVECNMAAVRLLGYTTRAQLLTRSAPSFAPEFQSDGTPTSERRKLVDAQLDDQGFYHGEWTFQTADGRPVAVQIAVSRVRIFGRRFDHAIWHDLSEQKAVESRVQALESRYRTIVEASNDIIYLLSETGRIRFTSPSFERLLGYAPEEIQDKSIGTLMHPEDVDRLRRQREEVGLPALTSQLIVYRMRTKAGEYRHLSTSAALQNDEHGELTIVVTAQDVTERVRTARDIEAARDAALASSRAKSEFLATVSHEVRTPLNGIIGASELLLESPLKPDEQDLVHVIRSSGESLLRIIDDILEISKAQAGRLSLVLSPTRASTLLREVTDLMRPRADEVGVELALQLDGESTRPILADVARLKQVVGNLLSNALKFTYSGRVQVRATTRTLSGGPHLRIEVEDTGIGIAPENLESIFLPFRQADGGIQRLFGGTGLGLAICKELVEAMHGRIGVESRPGKGSRFWFEVPVSPAPDEVAYASREIHVSTGTRVLVVEDHEVNRLVVTRMLTNLGCATDVATCGEEALKKIQEQDYDLVLMDVQMPGIDGLETTRRLRKDPRGKRLKVVALTANAFQEDREACIEAGMDDFLAKPIRRHDLARAIRRATN